jgi:hypothetical protein
MFYAIFGWTKKNKTTRVLVNLLLSSEYPCRFIVQRMNQKRKSIIVKTNGNSPNNKSFA